MLLSQPFSSVTNYSHLTEHSEHGTIQLRAFMSRDGVMDTKKTLLNLHSDQVQVWRVVLVFGQIRIENREIRLIFRFTLILR